MVTDLAPRVFSGGSCLNFVEPVFLRAPEGNEKGDSGSVTTSLICRHMSVTETAHFSMRVDGPRRAPEGPRFTPFVEDGYAE